MRATGRRTHTYALTISANSPVNHLLDDIEATDELAGDDRGRRSGRVVVTELPDYVGDWIAGARGGDDMWARAEKFLAQKRSGEIPRTRYFIEDHPISVDSSTTTSADSESEQSE
ncbi:hypothetical protein FB451DRAFT_1176290 [Mycena latifolia]|nr:hypothetical protein FB451DRAFT_1176290 [Mycena latifolia]